MHLALKQQMWSRLSSLPDNELTTFIFNEKNCGKLRIVNKHEIIVDGRLYDIVKKTVTGKQTTYVCINDTQEEMLLARMKQLNQQTHQPPQEKMALIIADNIIKLALAGKKEVIAEPCSKFHFMMFQISTYRVPGIERIFPPPEYRA